MLGISGLDLLAPAALGLVVFGPDKLPRMAADAGRLLRRARAHLNNARIELAGAVPPELSALTTIGTGDPSTRGLIRRALDVDDILKDLHAPATSQHPLPPLEIPQVPPYDTDTT